MALEHDLKRKYLDKFVKRFWETFPVYDVRTEGNTVRKRSFPKEDLEPEHDDVKRVTLLNYGCVVGYGLLLGHSFAQLSLIGTWGPSATVTAQSFSQALAEASEQYPALEWEWTEAHA